MRKSFSPAQLGEQLLGLLELLAPDLAARDERRPRHRRGQPDERDLSAPAHIGEAAHGAVVAARPRRDLGQEPFERALDVGVVVARHEAHRLGRPEPLHEDAARRPFARQADVAEVAGAGDVVGRGGADVGDERRENVHVVGGAAAAMPVEPAGDALREQLAHLRPRQRADMRIGEVGEAEHVRQRRGGGASSRPPSARRQALPMKMPAKSTSTPPRMTCMVALQNGVSM